MARPTISTTFNATDRVTPQLRQMQGRMTAFSRSSQRSLGSVTRGFGNMTRVVRLAGAALVTGLVGRGIGALVGAASAIEDATAAFTPLMGGAERAAQLVQRLNETAATTPFQFQQISDAAKQLLPVMNGDIERTVETFRMLGDTAGGNAQKLDSITRGYTKAMLQNKVTLESLNMIAEAGVPIFDQLAGELGVSTEQMFDMVSAGEVTTEALTRTFERMTTEGGIFANGMQIASETLSGLKSTAKDTLTATAASIGQTLLPIAKDLTSQFIAIAGRVREWVDANQELIQQRIQDTIQRVVDVGRRLKEMWDSGLIPALLGGVAAFMAVSRAIMAAQGVIAAIKAVREVMAAGNLLAMFNPVTLIAGAIAGAAFLIIRHWEPIKAFFQRLWDGIKQAFQSAMDWIRAAVQTIATFIQPVVDVVHGIGDFLSGNQVTMEEGRARNAEQYGISANSGVGAMAASYMERSTTNNASVDVNFRNAPIGTNARATGSPAPNVRMNYGMAGAGGR